MKSRNSIRVGLIALLAGLSGCGKEQTEAEKFYTAFPENGKLAGAQLVEKYEVPGAKHCLVDVRQIHYVQPDYSITGLQKWIAQAEDQIKEQRGKAPEQEILDLEREVENTKRNMGIYRDQVREFMKLNSAVQRDVYTIILQLNRDMSVDSVRAEGHIFDTTQKSAREMVTNVAQSFVMHGYMTAEEMRDETSYAFSPGAGDLLCARGLIKIKAGDNAVGWKERQDEYIQWAKKTRSDNQAVREEALREKRRMEEEKEDWIIMASSTEPYSTAIIGGDHNFKNNIELWNAKHPDDKFSLIVVTPQAYTEPEAKTLTK